MQHYDIFFSTFFILSSNLLSLAEGSSIIHIMPNKFEPKLHIDPQFDSKIGHNFILRRKGESLNLTCTVMHEQSDQNETLPNYNLDWSIPSLVHSTQKLVKGQAPNMVWLWFEQLSENHTENYTCNDVSPTRLRQPLASINIHLVVNKKMKYCGSHWFKCRSEHCIMKRFVCDGKNDCLDGEDESPIGCGPDPCYGKVFCNDRCVPPEWCCDYKNCSTTFGLRPWQPDIHKINYVQTALHHTVIGWAMACMFIITLLLIAICRVHIKKAMTLRWWQQNRNYFNQVEQNPTHGMNIIYNFNNGVQFIGRSEPPSYLEAMNAPLQDEPPPSYESCQDLMLPTVNMKLLSDTMTSSQTDIPLMASCNNDTICNDSTIIV